MTELNKICVTATAQTALKKLQKGQIPVYDCKKQGAYFIFCVKDKHLKKVFAIFAKPCYNISVLSPSPIKRVFSALVLRVGLVVGALIFALAAFVSDFFILKVEVTGSGSYLSEVVREIVAAEGGGTGKPFSSLNIPVASGKILSLPQVVFCNLSKRGSTLLVDVQVGGNEAEKVSRRLLVSDADGKVLNVVAICGTPVVSVGQQVKRGDILIDAVATAGDKTYGCLAVGYAELECRRQSECLASDDSPASIARAYASMISEEDQIISRTHKSYPAEGGVRLVIEVIYLHKVSINLT